MTQSLRQTILDTMIKTFRDYNDPNQPTPGAQFFSQVELGPLDDGDFRRRYSIGIVPGVERHKHLFPLLVNNLTVNVEFRVIVNKGDPAPGLMAEDMLARVKWIILQNRSWGGLAVDTELVGNQIELSTFQDKSVQGLCVCDVEYRHQTDDPYNPDPVL